jgi:Protein of unknown function (DUF4236)
MGFRFSRHVGILPGLRVNLSKSGVSLSAGVRGARITVGRTPRITLGIPGSGISWTETMEHGRRAPQRGAPQPVQPRSGLAILGWVMFLLFVLIAIGSGGHP